MIRVTVPRPAAEALMPGVCGRCRGVGHLGPATDSPVFLYGARCPTCDGSGSLPPVLRLLVVEGEPECSLGYECDDTTHDGRCGGPRPDPDIVRAIEAGERIGIDVECECGGTGRIEAEYWDLTDPNNHLGWVPCDCTAGLVPVGSVRPVRVLPIVHWSDNDEESPSCISVGHSDGRAFAAIGFSHNEVDLSVYGPAESLVGKFAVEVEEAQRA